MWPVTKAFDDVANPSNYAPHSPPNPLRSCFSGDILQCDVRLWPPGQIPTGASQAPHWTDNSQPLHLLLVAVTVAYHHQRLLITLLTPMGSGDHPSLHGLNHQGTFTAIAHVDPPPGFLTKRLTPGLDAVPGTLAWASPAARLRGLCVQVTQRRVRRYRQQVTLTQRCKPTPKPIRTPHLVVTGNPAMGQPGAVLGQQLQGQLVTRAIGSVCFGHTGFVQAGCILGPFFGQKKPLVHQGVALSGDVAQVHGHLTVVDFAQTTTPLPGHPYRLATRLGKPRGIEHQHTIALSQVHRDLTSQCRPQWLIVPRIPANKSLQGQARVAKTIRNRCDVFAFKVRQQTTDIGFGVLLGDLTLEDFDKGLHKGGKPWDDLLENLRGNLTFVEQLVFTNGVSRVHGKRLL